jgi:HK97 family phage major capsid protein
MRSIERSFGHVELPDRIAFRLSRREESQRPSDGRSRQLWDLPVVTSKSLTEGTFLVGDFKRAALVLDRQEIMVEVSTEHSDYFARNLIASRAEKLLGLIIQQPGAIIHGDFSTAT